nr:MAG TPA: hypothetical protein [Caudoviricetes sp.]
MDLHLQLSTNSLSRRLTINFSYIVFSYQHILRNFLFGRSFENSNFNLSPDKTGTCYPLH